jgi:hypothetical protein
MGAKVTVYYDIIAYDLHEVGSHAELMEDLQGKTLEIAQFLKEKNFGVSDIHIRAGQAQAVPEKPQAEETQ